MSNTHNGKPSHITIPIHEYEKLQGRIDELEKANREKLAKILKHENSIRLIQAQGIEEMLDKLYEMSSNEFSAGFIPSVDVMSIKSYIAKLRGEK